MHVPYRRPLVTWTLRIPAFQNSSPSVIFSSWTHAGFSNLLLMNRNTANYGTPLPRIDYKRALASILLTFLLAHWRKPAAILWATPTERPICQGTEGGLWPIAARNRDPQSKRPSGTETCQHQDWAWKQICPAWASWQLRLYERLNARGPSSMMTRFSTPKNCEINVHCFKLISFRVICYTVMGN